MADYNASKDASTEFQPALLIYSREKQQLSQLEKKIVPLSSADTVPPPPQHVPPPPQHVDPVIFISSFVRRLPQIPVNSESHLPTIFGRVPERCVTFCIDTSGSMFYALGVVKEHLIETLSILAAQDDNRFFNIIEFNTDVTKWSDKMVHCTPATVAAAKQWVGNLTVKTGTNTQDALLTALSDPACQAVYLVTDDIPDRHTDEVVNNIVDVCDRCRIHCIYISCENLNEDVVDFLEDLAVETCGSIHIVTLTYHGCIDRITPIYRADHSRGELVQALKNTLQSSVKACSIPITPQFDPEVVLGLSIHPNSSAYPPFVYLNALPHPVYPYYWSRLYSRHISLKQCDTFINPLFNFSSAAGKLLVGMKVIARRIQDGYFYRGTVKCQVSRDTFLVEFPPCRHYNLYQTEYEDVSVFDIVDCTATQNRTISTGDRVLASCETGEDKFTPGIVVTGQDRQAEKGLGKYAVTVCFSNGQIRQVPEDVVVLIPPVVYDKFTQELQMPQTSSRSLLSPMRGYSLENKSEHPSVNYKTNSIKYHGIDSLAVKSSSYLWDPATYRHSSFLPAFFGQAPFVISQKEGSFQGVREDILYNSALPPGLDVMRLKDQDVIQEPQPSYGESYEKSYEERSQEVADDKISYSEEAVTFSKSPRLLARREKQKEAYLSNLVEFNNNERIRESQPAEKNYFGDLGYDRHVRQVQKLYSGESDDSTIHFVPASGHENEESWKKVLYCNYRPPSGELNVSPTEKFQNISCTGPFRGVTLQSSLKMLDQNYLCSDVKDYNIGQKSTTGHCDISEERIQTNKGKRFQHFLKPEAQQKERIAKKDSMKAHLRDDLREIILNKMEKDSHQKIQEQVDFQQACLSKKKVNSELKSKIIVY